jgi:hypothetical protein
MPGPGRTLHSSVRVHEFIDGGHGHSEDEGRGNTREICMKHAAEQRAVTADGNALPRMPSTQSFEGGAAALERGPQGLAGAACCIEI